MSQNQNITLILLYVFALENENSGHQRPYQDTEESLTHFCLPTGSPEPDLSFPRHGLDQITAQMKESKMTHIHPAWDLSNLKILITLDISLLKALLKNTDW